MHYYKRNLGDYAKKAGRLSMLQHGAYNLLIDACYDREKFPTFEEAVEWTWASTEAEVEAVRFVLTRFFRLGDDGLYVQDRILEELLDYHRKSDKNKRIAQERESKRTEASTKRARNVYEASPKKHEAPPNQEPITNNQEPITLIPPTQAPGADGRFERFWKAYPRKVGKDAAEKAFAKRKPSNQLLDEMLLAIEKQSSSIEWTKDNGQYIPNPATWLNQGRWKDGEGELSNAMPEWMMGAI